MSIAVAGRGPIVRIQSILGFCMLAGIGALPARGEDPKCSEPSFSFKWVGAESVQLVAKAKPAARYRVWIEESQRSQSRPTPLAIAVNGGQPITAGESDEGRAYAVELTGLDLLKSAGRVRIWYRQEPACAVAASSEHRFALIEPAFLEALSRNSLYAAFKVREVPAAKMAVPTAAQPEAAAPRPGGASNASFIGPEGQPPAVSTREAAVPNVEQVEGVVVLEQHHLSIDIGPVFVMKNDGTFETDGELSLNASSRWSEMWGASVDLRLSSLNLPQSSAQPAAGGSSSPVALSSSNVFEGTARAIFYPGGAPWNVPNFALVLGAGTRSRLNAESRGRDPLLEANLLAGVRLQVPGYNVSTPADSLADTRGFIEVGYTRDRYWKDAAFQSDQRNRFYAEGQLEIPGLGGKNLRVLMRVRGSKPMQFDGPSDLRVSALAAINPAIFGTIFGMGK